MDCSYSHLRRFLLLLGGGGSTISDILLVRCVGPVCLFMAIIFGIQ